MIPESLLGYLQDCQGKQLSWDAVSEQLNKSGWNSEQIASAKDWYVTSPKAPTPQSKSKLKLTVGLTLAVLLLLASALSVSAYLVATDKIPLKNATLKRQISQVVFSIPFIPKTPKFILQQSQFAHQSVSRSSFDFSLAITSESGSLTQMLGANNLDISIKGYTDYSDIKNPRGTLAAWVTKDFGVELKKPDQNNLYVKVNKLPLFLFVFLGITDTAQLNSIVTQNWIHLDTSTLDTEARQYLGSGIPDTSTRSDYERALEEVVSKLILEDVLPTLATSSDILDDFQVYKIQFKPTAQLLDKIFDTLRKESEKMNPATPSTVLGINTSTQKASDYLKDLVLTVYVDKKDYFVRKSEIAFSAVFDSGAASPTGKFTFAGVLKLSDFGSEMPISAPDKSITPEELYQQLFSDPQLLEGVGLFGAINPTTQIAKARDAKRRSDANTYYTALNIYSVDNDGQLPTQITSYPYDISSTGVDLCKILVPNYLVALPVDPSLDSGQTVSNCNSSYSIGYTVYKNSDGELAIGSPLFETEDNFSYTR